MVTKQKKIVHGNDLCVNISVVNVANITTKKRSYAKWDIKIF